MKIAFVLFFGLVLVAVQAATTIDSGFLDSNNAKPTKPTSRQSPTTEKLHKIDLDRNEVVEDRKMSQFNVTIDTTQDQGISTTPTVPTTTVPVVTTKSPSTVKPTTSAVPLDDHTTEKTKVTTEKAKASTPAPDVPESHLWRWILAGIFCGVFVVILSMYVYKFYINRTESSYQNL